MPTSVSPCVPPAPAAGGPSEFGDWNAFPGGQMPPSVQPAVTPSGNNLFGGMTPSLTPAPAAAPSADLFDLMGPTQTISSSQSLNFSMSSMQSMSTMGMPQSMSQVLHSYTRREPCGKHAPAVG